MSFLKGPVVPGLLAVGVAVGSAGGALALLSDRGDGKAVAAPVRNAVWTVEGAQDAPSASELAGVWVTADVVVRAGLDGLHAVKRSDGTGAWDLPVPAAAGSVCALSLGIGGGVGVFSYSKEEPGNGPCEGYAGVDLGTGKVLWTGHSAGVQEVALDSGVAVVRDSASVSGVDTRTGAVKWTQDAKNGCQVGAGVFVADHGRVAVTQDCATGHVAVLDVLTGARVASVTPGFTTGQAAAGVLAEPLVVADSAEKTTALSFRAGVVGLPYPMTSWFPQVGSQVQARADVSVGGGVLCFGGSWVACYTTAGKVLDVHTLPGAAKSPVTVVPVESLSGDAARVIVMAASGTSHATLCRVTTDGSLVAEAQLSLPVSAFLVGNPGTSQVFAYGDAKDLVLVAGRPAGATALVDVRLG